MAILGRLLRDWLSPAVLLSLGLAGLTTAAAPMQDVTSHDVEVAFIYNFAKFIEWPPAAFSSRTAPLRICVAGAAVEGLLVLEGKRAQERSIAVQAVLRPGDARSCHILFFPEAEKERFIELSNAVKDRSVLTVGDSDGFAERGGMIGFFLENRRVRFAINLQVARSAGLTLSSKLLAVSRLVQAP